MPGESSILCRRAYSSLRARRPATRRDYKKRVRRRKRPDHYLESQAVEGSWRRQLSRGGHDVERVAWLSHWTDSPALGSTSARLLGQRCCSSTDRASALLAFCRAEIHRVPYDNRTVYVGSSFNSTLGEVCVHNEDSDTVSRIFD